RLAGRSPCRTGRARRGSPTQPRHGRFGYPGRESPQRASSVPFVASCWREGCPVYRLGTGHDWLLASRSSLALAFVLSFQRLSNTASIVVAQWIGSSTSIG